MMRVTQTGRRERRAGRRGKEEYGEPCLEKGQLLLSREPDWLGIGSTPTNATSDCLPAKRRMSPISAMS